MRKSSVSAHWKGHYSDQSLKYSILTRGQFTNNELTGQLEPNGIVISMDGRVRALDNIFVERLWRSVKYEEVYINDCHTVMDAVFKLSEYFKFYNNQRPHQSLDYQTPFEAYTRK